MGDNVEQNIKDMYNLTLNLSKFLWHNWFLTVKVK